MILINYVQLSVAIVAIIIAVLASRLVSVIFKVLLPQLRNLSLIPFTPISPLVSIRAFYIAVRQTEVMKRQKTYRQKLTQ